MLNMIQELLKITYIQAGTTIGLDMRYMLGNMHKMAAPSGLPSGNFIGP